jgi:hypothetical protein
MIKNAKTTYYSSVISSNAHNLKVLFSTVDKLLHRKPEKRYPTASSTTDLVNKFADFFSKKIAIRNKLKSRKNSNLNQAKITQDISTNFDLAQAISASCKRPIIFLDFAIYLIALYNTLFTVKAIFQSDM